MGGQQDGKDVVHGQVQISRVHVREQRGKLVRRHVAQVEQQLASGRGGRRGGVGRVADGGGLVQPDGRTQVAAVHAQHQGVGHETDTARRRTHLQDDVRRRAHYQRGGTAGDASAAQSRRACDGRRAAAGASAAAAARQPIGEHCTCCVSTITITNNKKKGFSSERERIRFWRPLVT